MITLLNMDCMEYMKTVPDKYFDLAIVDPPYGIGMDSRRLNGRDSRGRYRIKQSQYLHKIWDNEKPGISYHEELKRISINQIVWGANYLPSGVRYDGRWIVWYKNGQSSAPDSSDCELACSSFDGVIVKMFQYDWVGFGAINVGENRIHPTQKPVALYKWILKNYATPEMKIFDSHGGSMSLAIACHDFGSSECVICELDKEYYDMAVERYNRHISQMNMFKLQDPDRNLV